MKLNESKVSIANLRDMLIRGDLVANKAYQRAQGLWPNASRSYFIDTILEGYPFPKMYFHEFLDRKSKKVRTEIVDGQQRITTIYDFLGDKFALGKNSQRFAGKKFSDLDEEIQDEFLLYTVATDVIRDAGTAQILQMFRRMNSYTLPLNAAEKRHSEFFGEFKDMVTRVLDNKSILADWEILTTRQIVRMADATFVADLILAMEEGIVNTSDKKLHDLYKKYDATFPAAGQYEAILYEIFNFITLELSPIQSSFMTKPYAMHALCCALYHNKYGMPKVADQLGIQQIGSLINCTPQQASDNLLELAAAHEGNDLTRFPLYVEAMREGSNRERQRSVRIATLCRALRNEL
jgi:hypothetical protein